MEYKKHFTDEELRELLDWFEKNKDILPESLYLDKATFIKDFKHTLRLYYDIVHEHKDNPTYSGQIYQLFKARKVIEQKMAEGAKP